MLCINVRGPEPIKRSDNWLGNHLQASRNLKRQKNAVKVLQGGMYAIYAYHRHCWLKERSIRSEARARCVTGDEVLNVISRYALRRRSASRLSPRRSVFRRFVAGLRLFAINH